MCDLTSNMRRDLVITPEEFEKYEFEINNVQAKEAEDEQQMVQDFLEFIEDCLKAKGSHFRESL